MQLSCVAGARTCVALRRDHLTDFRARHPPRSASLAPRPRLVAAVSDHKPFFVKRPRPVPLFNGEADRQPRRAHLSLHRKCRARVRQREVVSAREKSSAKTLALADDGKGGLCSSPAIRV
eukprot:COSAG02_NODE_9658_length_2150_cov_1.590931_3_plen_120_part_00